MTLLLLGAAAAVRAEVLPAGSASFDCVHAVPVDEQIICSDARLRRADLALDRHYHEVLDAAASMRGDEIRADERVWLARRNRECAVAKGTRITDGNRATYVDCFLDAYAERESDLTAIAAHPETPPAAISTPIRKSSWGAGPKKLDRVDDLMAGSSIRPLASATGDVVAWLDDHTTVVLGMSGDAAARPEKASLLLWDPASGVKPLAADVVDAGWNGEVCINGATVFLIDPGAKRGGHTLMRRFGRDGSSNAVVAAPDAGRVGCEFSTDPSLVHHVIALAPARRATIDLGGAVPPGGDADGRVLMLQEGQAGPRALEPAIHVDTQMRLQARYSAFAGAFVLTQTPRTGAVREVVQRRWAKTNCLPYWVVAAASGVASRACLPYAGYSAVEPQPLPTKIGPVFPVALGGSGQWSGLYLLKGGEPFRLVEGEASLAAVSPDGCHVAFALGNGKAPSTVHVLDVCRATP